MNRFVIPNALQIVIDDLGWMNAKDDRENRGPSRTAMPRNHVAEDYAAVNELGKALGMKINCAFVIGEWDPDNRLKKLPHFSKYGDDWDNAKYLDREELAKIVEVVNASDYIDISIHGLMHGYYMEGTDNWDASDFCYHKNGVLKMIPESEVRARLDAFFEILIYHGVNKKINSHVPSSACYCYNEISKILSDYGIMYVIQPFAYTDFKGEEPHLVTVENGIVTTDRCHFFSKELFSGHIDNVLPWNECESDFLSLPKATRIVGTHWPNYLHRDSAKNGELLENAVKYFKSCADEFGVLMSKDTAFYSTQALYKRFSKTEESGNEFTVDVSEVPMPIGNLGKFYVSAKSPITAHSGCEIKLYETKETHLTYEVIPMENVMKFSI